ncbi:MAG: shikimate kinase [Chthoniobacterales bacterium]
MPAPARNILLVGFMGTGKSSLARILARKTGCLLVDTDAAIEKKAGEPISAIFAGRGENVFREIETEVLRSHLGQSGCIISTGGGMVVREENRRLLPQIGLVVWLRASEEVIFERVSRNNRRPLLQTPDPRGTLHDLLVLREPWYREVAQLEIDTGKVSRGQAVSTVLEAAGWSCKPN